MALPDAIDYEQLPGDPPPDETDLSLRAYLARLADEHLAQYDPSWSDEQIMEWDGNFRSDGALMLVCCERDVDVREFRRVLASHLAVRFGDAGNSEKTRCSDGSSK
jgi:hypothetical protein